LIIQKEISHGVFILATAVFFVPWRDRRPLHGDDVSGGAARGRDVIFEHVLVDGLDIDTKHAGMYCESWPNAGVLSK